uniref:Ubiquitin-like protein 3 n=1 Tax=Poecilia mexicana TaxID=48701 RepID=A0A3B3XFG2_9TELE
MSGSTSADMINLRLILVSGKTKEFLFSPNDSAADIAKHVYDNWPMDWEEEQVSSPNILRLIYQGRFLHGNVTLGALKLPLGRTTVMHLVARETLPEPNSQGNELSIFPVSIQRTFPRAEELLNIPLPAIIYFYTWFLFQEQPVVQIIGTCRFSSQDNSLLCRL